MAETPSSVRGMYDLLPPTSAKWQHLESTCREIFARFGYAEARPPVVEHTDLFVRGVGESTDIVGKEMYTFRDRADRSLTLRPELTAGLARAYIEHSMAAKEAVTRWWSIGPVFRYEAVNAGRYRQFWQVDCEAYGVAEPTLDAEVVAMLHALYTRLKVEPLTMLINNVGQGDDRARYRDALVAFLSPRASELCADCQRRLVTNPLRVLDCKVDGCKAIVRDAPSVLAYLGDGARAHFDRVQATLTELGVPFTVDDRLVRGLDYYTGTVFELTTTAGNLGSQSTIVAGGRYDNMIEELGGPKTPAIGFGIGVERTVLCMPDPAEQFVAPIGLYIAAHGADARTRATALAHRLRLAGVTVEVEHREVGMKAQFRRADKLGARLTLALGEAELASGQGKLKDMTARTETPVALADLATIVPRLLAG
ncbi:MAG TPA: histidine--tRNA ligase [Kofleriaceae bacterium]|nr:histidine--tRNA ligase [Kofleriaceae bacterium]